MSFLGSLFKNENISKEREREKESENRSSFRFFGSI